MIPLVRYEDIMLDPVAGLLWNGYGPYTGSYIHMWDPVADLVYPVEPDPPEKGTITYTPSDEELLTQHQQHNQRAAAIANRIDGLMDPSDQSSVIFFALELSKSFDDYISPDFLNEPQKLAVLLSQLTPDQLTQVEQKVKGQEEAEDREIHQELGETLQTLNEMVKVKEKQLEIEKQKVEIEKQKVEIQILT